MVLSKEEICHYCKTPYSGAFQEHWNGCFEARKAGNCFPPTSLFQSTPDWGDQPKRQEYLDIRKICPHCHSEYHYSWQDHAERCDRVAMNRIAFEKSLRKRD